MSFLQFLPGFGSSTSDDGVETVTFQVRHIATLTLLSELDGEIYGRHRLQKLVFLTDGQLEDDYDLYSYRKYDYGPYSKQLEQELRGLESKGLLRIDKHYTFGGDARYRFILLPDGETALQNASSDGASAIRTVAGDVAAEYGDLPLSNFLDLVRERHPSYWENSVYRTRH